jgi:4-hydroxythreonine-4-phosphate dehydrogenase
MTNKLVAVSCGDPNGISYEITVKALKALPFYYRKRIILIGSKEVLLKANFKPYLCDLIDVSCGNFKVSKGKIDKNAGLISFKSFQLAAKLARDGKVSAIVTAPISKEAWLEAGINYLGHTDYFCKVLKKEPLMSFHAGDINSALITEHLPISKVSSALSIEKIKRKVLLFNSILKRLKLKGEILISALNPHCGENGKIGWEEERIIKPAIRLLKNKMRISGPYNSDDIFKKYFSQKAAGMIFIYHDQLLGILKNIVNPFEITHITWGLDFVRTSPTHGTAFDIAWQNKADHLGMYNSIIKAFELNS